MKLGKENFAFDWTDITDETQDARSAAVRSILTALWMSYEKDPTENRTTALIDAETPHQFLDKLAVSFDQSFGLFEGGVKEVFIRCLTGVHGIEIVIRKGRDGEVKPEQLVVVVFLDTSSIVSMILYESGDFQRQAENRGVSFSPTDAFSTLIDRRVRLIFKNQPSYSAPTEA